MIEELKEQYEVSRVKWRGIAMDVRHCRNWLNQDGTDHIEVETDGREELPITQTGYKSHFIASVCIAEAGTATNYVLLWLDHAAQSPEWRKREAAARQLSLF